MLIRDAQLADGRVRDVRVRDGRIVTVGRNLQENDDRVLDAHGNLLLPGAIDVHVHFREPGDSHKETWTTGSRSAAAGGVTTVVDQPNTDPPTTTGEAFDEKAALARDSLVDYGINGGVTPDWDPDSLFERPLFALGEVFLADSTGDMGIDVDLFREALERARDADVPVTVHAEDADLFSEAARERSDVPESDPLGSTRDGGRPADADAWSAFRTAEAEIAAVERACDVAVDAGTTIHVAHTSTPEAVDLAHEAGMTCEVTPHHLYLSRDDYEELGTFGRMNPPLRSDGRRADLFARLDDGTVDVVATDHAPHTRAEKDASIWDAPSGVPGVETMLPLLLDSARRGDLHYERIRDVTARNPARLFGLPEKGRIAEGYDADLVLVDPDAPREIRGAALHTNCEWTPFEGRQGVFPLWTMVRGELVYERTGEDERFGDAVGENVRE
ncbi:dihydroorotase [Halomarina oriensis]|uniref:Dihydroorotase n=1 Tax=Halomarina oriensis TaxID=671145 RepID=A0A6B0GM35_9EURY|nr:dihydroorotase [Halomarina oriensis]MWG34961.1 dihydroorotase [Halomarina oriensis]